MNKAEKTYAQEALNQFNILKQIHEVRLQNLETLEKEVATQKNSLEQSKRSAAILND
jgi:hypothetical protein